MLPIVGTCNHKIKSTKRNTYEAHQQKIMSFVTIQNLKQNRIRWEGKIDTKVS